MAIERELVNNIFIMAPDGPGIGMENHDEMEEAFAAAEESKAKYVAVDLRNVERIDSVGLGAFIQARRRLRGKSEVHICNLTPMVDNLFRLSKLDMVLPVHSSLAVLLDSLGKE